jgi:hypothetical protein
MNHYENFKKRFAFILSLKRLALSRTIKCSVSTTFLFPFVKNVLPTFLKSPFKSVKLNTCAFNSKS